VATLGSFVRSLASCADAAGLHYRQRVPGRRSATRSHGRQLGRVRDAGHRHACLRGRFRGPLQHPERRAAQRARREQWHRSAAVRLAGASREAGTGIRLHHRDYVLPRNACGLRPAIVRRAEPGIAKTDRHRGADLHRQLRLLARLAATGVTRRIFGPHETRDNCRLPGRTRHHQSSRGRHAVLGTGRPECRVGRRHGAETARGIPHRPGFRNVEIPRRCIFRQRARGNNALRTAAVSRDLYCLRRARFDPLRQPG